MKKFFYISALLKSVIIGVIVFLVSFFALEVLSLARRYVEAKEFDARYDMGFDGKIIVDKKEHKYYVIEQK